MAAAERTTVGVQTYDQSFISGDNSGNNNSLNTTNYYCVPETFKQLITSTEFRVSPPEINLDYLCDEYTRPEAGTGEWIFEDERYVAWRSARESKLLWLCGGPGTGKTMLAKHIAAEFLKGLDDPPNGVELVYLFISPELPIEKISTKAELPQPGLAKIISDLLYGILQQDEKLFDSYRAELRKQGNIFFTNPYSLWKVLRKAILDCQTDPIYILIDGVDGLKEGLCKELIERILLLMTIRKVKIFLSSREVPHVSNNLSRHTKINLDTSGFITGDVETFIKHRVSALDGWDDDLKQRAREAILAKAEGTFLWASLVIENLTYLSSGPDFKYFLNELPLKLENLYRKMLGSLTTRRDPREVLNMIRSVALALRPLTFGELGHILACLEEKVKTEQPSHGGACASTSTEVRTRTDGEIRKYVQSSLGFLRATDTTVSIVHHTAREYLFDQKRQDNLPVLSKSEVDLIVSWECFRYLHRAFADPEEFLTRNVSGHHDNSYNPSLHRYRQGETPGEAAWEVARKDPCEAVARWPCLRYAAESWFIHARRTLDISRDKFYHDSTRNWLRHQFFETSDVVRKPWIKLCRDPKMEALAGEQTPLHIAVCLGLLPLVEKALSDSTKRSNSNLSPLHLAARFMSGTYEILIAGGEASLLTAPDRNSNTPLHEAAISGHWPMLVGLVKKFAAPAYSTYREINKKNHHGNTPLHLAFQFDHPDMVEFLSKNGADLSIKNGDQLTASELGARLERGDSLDILERAEKIWEETKEESVKGPVEGEPVEGPVEEPRGSPRGRSSKRPRRKY
ncbi:hypothetical protein B9Z19DRAFT_1060428 [Tuber borchii]|uniref:NACHT domain-containing protein n=1 Tax=Tuber borchii TaxID=42251 RepID=A0A2T7A8W9_TUBBO|nr:hypothetical protein B9Z19DRAFT_1060428 [Tuber borchii]